MFLTEFITILIILIFALVGIISINTKFFENSDIKFTSILGSHFYKVNGSLIRWFIPMFAKPRIIRFSFKFSRTTRAQIPEGEDGGDINKMFGATTTFHPHWISALFGFVFSPKIEDEIMMYAYCHQKDFSFDFKKLINIKEDVTYIGYLKQEGNKFVYTIFDTNYNKLVEEKIEIDGLKKLPPFRFKLISYHGGQKKAKHSTHDIMIHEF